MTNKYFLLSAIIAGCFFFASCSKDEDDNIDGSTSGSEVVDKETGAILNNDIAKYVTASVTYKDYMWNISVKSQLSGVYPQKYIRYGILCGYNGVPYVYTKYIANSGTEFKTSESLFIDATGSPYSSLYLKSYIALNEKIARGEKLSSDEQDLLRSVKKILNEDERPAFATYWGQVFAEIDGKKYVVYKYGKERESVNSGTGSGTGTGSGSGGSTSGYEKPDIGYYDVTTYRNKLKVVYKIYNKDEAKVTSAKVYYGTTSNPAQSVTATVSGTLITANISGLKAGTTYYVKCVATGKGGTTTTSTTKLMTLY